MAEWKILAHNGKDPEAGPGQVKGGSYVIVEALNEKQALCAAQKVLRRAYYVTISVHLSKPDPTAYMNRMIAAAERLIEQGQTSCGPGPEQKFKMELDAKPSDARPFLKKGGCDGRQD